MQSLPLSAKIRMTQNRIRAWCDYWNDEVYVSFSGGKDSTVLVDIITKMGYKDIPLVFVDTGLEYPEIREFVKGYGDRVAWLRPKMNFKQVIEKYGYPFISKEISQCVYEVLKPKSEGKDITQYAQYKRLCGTYSDKGFMDRKKYKFLLDAPFWVSNKCCSVMKKNPIRKYAKENNKKGITAQMAQESKLRLQKWLQNGCNGFELKEPISNPMSFWTEQDVLRYIKDNDLPICSVYGEIVEDLEGTEEVEGQLTMSDIEGWENQGMFDAERLPLKTTGCNRTGCMFCGFGCHLEKDEGRFVRMKRTHPKQYEYIMKPWEEGGLNYKEIIDWINEHGNMNIKY